MPHVDGRTGHRAAARGDVENGEREGDGYALGLAGRFAETAANVGADHAALFEYVRTVRAVTRVGAGGLVRNLGQPGGVDGRGGRRPRRGGGRGLHATGGQQATGGAHAEKL